MVYLLSCFWNKGSNASPDDIFAAIRTLIATAQSTANGKATLQWGYSNLPAGYGNLTLSFSFSPKFVVLISSGGITKYIYFCVYNNQTAFGLNTSNGDTERATVSMSGTSFYIDTKAYGQRIDYVSIG